LAALDVAYIGWQRVPIYRFGIAPNKLMDYLMARCAVLHSVEAGNDPGAEAGAGLTVPPELLAPIFGARVNEVVMVPTRAGFAVAQVLEVVQADPASEPQAITAARRNAQAQAAEDLEAQFVAALRARANPRISQTLLPQVVP
jgi:hypothetical protein